MKVWTELVAEDDAIGSVREWAAAAAEARAIVVCEPARDAGIAPLEALQVTTRSPLGAVAFHTGGLLIDHGWLRILGAGCGAIPRALGTWNGLPVPEDGTTARRFDAGLLVGDDVVGGFFAWFAEPRTVHYFAPDTLRWEDLGLGYAEWLAWCLSERLETFYGDFRWFGWQASLAELHGDQGFSIYPPLFASGPPLAERSRRAVAVEELWSLGQTLAKQI